MAKYKVYFDGGEYNGAERYYDSLSVARRVASRYVRESRRSIFENICCEIYLVEPRVFQTPFECIDIYSFR